MLTLEDFGVDSSTLSRPGGVEQNSSTGLGAFDDGYKAGWDDATRSLQEEQMAISAELGRNLEELSVTYFEARRQVCLSLRPFVDAIVEKILPELSRENTADVLRRYVDEVMSDEATATAILVVSEADAEAISSRLPDHDNLDVEVRVEPSFAPGQIRLTLGDECHEVDHARLLEEVKAAASDFYSTLTDISKVG